jgi:hypothetical protein
MESKKLLICISFHYVESRIENLKKIVDCFLNYKLKTTIVIDCNQDFKFFEEYDNIIVKTHNNLSHPFHLTSMHRLTMVDEIDYFDYFMYVEDDMLVPYENFLEYINNFDELYKINCVPSFVRIEEFSGTEYIVDFTYRCAGTSKININDKTFVNLDQPYHAFWILPSKELKYSINENFVIVDTNRELSASYVMWGLNKTPYVLMDGNKINKLSCSYHLTNNYTKMEDTPFGKIELDSVIFN